MRIATWNVNSVKQRLEAALTARTVAELEPLLADLTAAKLADKLRSPPPATEAIKALFDG